MDFICSLQELRSVFDQWAEQYDLFAPVRMEGDGCFSDTDVIRYGKITAPEEICWENKSDYSFKEVLMPISETLFYFTEEETTVPAGPEKGRLIFLRACDLNAVKRLDEIYLRNGFEDFYYARVRKQAKFVMMGCPESCDSGFCVTMDTNHPKNFDAYINKEGEQFSLKIQDEALRVKASVGKEVPVELKLPKKNIEQVTLPKKLSNKVFSDLIWQELGGRCIACGRCNFVCPTCTCFTMQDIFYKDNQNVGERRRVWASCEVDGFTSIAGGHEFRSNKADRMRFKVLHKIYDFQKRFGYTMCVGCGRCDDVCPEYISYSTTLNRLAEKEAAK